MTDHEIKPSYERDEYVAVKGIIDNRDLDPMGRKIGRLEKYPNFQPSILQVLISSLH